jgi:DNA (cytosine-5)-methyltransferase 1
MNVLDLFSGVGGFSLGLERAGMRTVAFCEIEPYCQAVLRKHWPGVPVFPDVRKFRTSSGNWDHWAIDVICGGFPCQDISVAGKGVGIDGSRSGIWSEYARIIGEVRPTYVIVENVATLLGRGLGRVLGDLAALGFDAEWHCIPASAIGAPHRRDRVWIVAHSDRGRQLQPQGCEQNERRRVGNGGQDVAYANDRSLLGSAIAWPQCHPWLAEPNVGRVAHGVPARVDRLRALGNAIVPQIAEIIGKAIMAYEHC